MLGSVAPNPSVRVSWTGTTTGSGQLQAANSNFTSDTGGTWNFTVNRKVTLRVYLAQAGGNGANGNFFGNGGGGGTAGGYSQHKMTFFPLHVYTITIAAKGSAGASTLLEGATVLAVASGASIGNESAINNRGGGAGGIVNSVAPDGQGGSHNGWAGSGGGGGTGGSIDLGGGGAGGGPTGGTSNHCCPPGAGDPGFNGLANTLAGISVSWGGGGGAGSSTGSGASTGSDGGPAAAVLQFVAL